MRLRWAFVGLLLAPAAVHSEEPPPPPVSSCIACHDNPDIFDEDQRAIVESFRHGVHASAGLTCEACHGGNPDPALADDLAAMDEHDRENPFLGAPTRSEIPAFCGRCHSDPVYMKRFNPELRIDQEREYGTSRHGQLLRRGDAKVATCIDCHGTHGILAVGDPQSPVYPKHVAETCAQCHADPTHMAGYELPDGRPLPVDQFSLWSQSVHARALLEGNDLSAPTCNDCHGNHGAVPPGINSIAFVCGHCHAREAELFRASRKRQLFDQHNDYLATASPDGCAACHEAPDPPATLTTVHSFSECATCHGNHGIVHPTLAMLAPLLPTPCALCHEPPGPLASTEAEPLATRVHYEQLRDDLLADAEHSGLEGSARFDWLIDQARTLATHTVTGPASGEIELRPEFERLFEKFRVGKTSYLYRDPATGKMTRGSVVRCSDCHAKDARSVEHAVGYETSSAFLDGMRRLTGLTARAERILLTARRGGVETRPALLEIDQAVDAQVQLEVLVHTFSSGPGSPFDAKREEGLAHAQAALESGQRALAELSYRRRGLMLALVFVGLVLIALALKIRQLSRPGSAPRSGT